MFSRLRNLACGGVLAALAGLAAAPAWATPLVVPDVYYGGTNTYNGSDVIGPTNVFDITDAVIERVGPGGDTLQITIDTNYAGVPGTAAADGTGYGVLFITPGYNAWNPTGTAPNYATDVYVPGEWKYAATIPMVPGSSSGSGGLYLTSGGTVVNSNVGSCNFQTYPLNSSCGWYFRSGQAVQFTPGSGPVAGTSETWTVGSGTITFDIVDDGLLGDDFAFAWAMTCGNDVIQGEAWLPDVPEPPTWSLLLAGMLLVGGIGWHRRRGNRNPA